MNSDFDEGSFPKARGWLLGFSSLLLGLAFFGANFEAISVLGTKINFTKNNQHVWLVASLALTYFIVRLYQLRPTEPTEHDKRLSTYNNDVLTFIIKLTRRKSIFDHVAGEYIKNPEKIKSVRKIIIIQSNIEMVTAPQPHRRWKQNFLHHLSYEAVAFAKFPDGSSAYSQNIRASETATTNQVRLSGVVARIMLWIRTSAFTEYVFPYCWGCAALLASLNEWLHTAS